MDRGGKREGAGRPPTPAHIKRETCPVRLPRWLIEELDRRDGSRGEIIEAALVKALKVKPPHPA
jgi:hypothetical protein